MSKPVQGNVRSDALNALSEDQRKQLAAYAEIMSRGTDREGKDVLHDAFVRWLASDKPVEGPEQTCDFLRGAINSVSFNVRRHEKVVRHYDGMRETREPGEEDPLDKARDLGASTEGPLFIQQVYDLCGDDEEVQLLLMLQADNATPDDIRTELRWDEKKYKAVQKRKRRLVIRWKLEGKLP